MDFTFFPRINDAFVRPLYPIGVTSTSGQTSSASQDEQNMMDIDNPDLHSDTDTDKLVMNVSSLDDSTALSKSNSDISINSDDKQINYDNIYKKKNEPANEVTTSLRTTGCLVGMACTCVTTYSSPISMSDKFYESYFMWGGYYII